MRLISALLLLFSCFPYSGLAQTNIHVTEPVDPKSIRAWAVQSPGEYAGVYHFGVSEVESDLVLCVEPGLITAQITSAHWSADGKRRLADYRNLRHVRIAGNRFTADQLSGEFVTFTDEDGQRQRGLRVRQPWSASVEKGQWEVGSRYTDLATQFDYPFGFVSYRLLRPADVQGRSPEQLLLMRNEVFARYGFIFSQGGAMNQHFRHLSWYQPQHHDVSSFLTELERRNLVLIRQQEAGR